MSARNRVVAAVSASVAVTLAGGTFALPAAAEPAASAGAISAAVERQPFDLSFSDEAGVNVLRQAAGTGTGPVGALGFKTASGWRRATRVASGGAIGGVWAGLLETTDPGGRSIELVIRPDGEGVIAVSARVVGGATADVTQTGISFLTRQGERYMGFGERSNAVDQRGTEIEHYVSDGPYLPQDRSVIQAFIPPQGFRARDDATYFPMPWLLSTAGYGVLIDDTEPSRHRLGVDAAGAWSMEVDADQLNFRVIAGPTPADVVRRLTERTGRQPAPAAPWLFGAWFHAGQENQPPAAREQAATATQRAADVPISAVETHLRYLPCGSAVGRRAYEQQRTTYFHENGLATLAYFNPEICTDYEPIYSQAVAADVLTETSGGAPYVYDAFVGDRTPSDTPISQIDFTAPGADAFFADQMRAAVEDGHDGWMEDFGEYTPLDSVSANGMTGAEMHNFYPVPYHRSGWSFASSQSRPIIRHIRSGWTGVHPYAQIVWGGDPTTDFGYDGLRSSVTQALTMGMSGIGIWGSDIGGYFTLFAPKLTNELLARWVQFGAVSGVMRTKFAGFTLEAGRRVQVYDPEAIGNWRRYTKLRTQLYPYIAGAAAEYRRSGMPLMRHLALAYPEDAQAASTDDQFLFGPDLLAAPVLENGQRERGLYLPEGRWIDFWDAVTYKEATGDLVLRKAKTRKGGSAASTSAGIDELPLMIRAGALIAMLPADTDTLADRYDGPSVTSLREQRGEMELMAFPRGRSSGTFLDGEDLLSREKKGHVWKLRIRGDSKRRWRIKASLSTLKRPFRPRCVVVDGKRLSKKRWSYAKRKKRIAIRVKARRAVITARERCG